MVICEYMNICKLGCNHKNPHLPMEYMNNTNCTTFGCLGIKKGRCIILMNGKQKSELDRIFNVSDM